jgi:hypothetical protein
MSYVGREWKFIFENYLYDFFGRLSFIIIFCHWKFSLCCQEMLERASTEQNWWFRCVLLMTTTNKKERKPKISRWYVVGSQSQLEANYSTGNETFILDRTLFHFNRVGTLDTQIAVRDSIILWLRKEMPREMEKCTIKLNHWIVIASFRFILGHYCITYCCCPA